MKQIKKCNVLLILALIFWSQQTWATDGCWFKKGLITKNINLRSIVVQGDAPIGTTLAKVEVPVETGLDELVNCPSSLYGFRGVLPYASSLVGNSVYQTSTAGIGIRVGQMYYATSNYVPGANYPPSPRSYTDQPVSVELIKTGDIKSGQMNSGIVARYQWTRTTGEFDTVMQIAFAVPVRVTVVSCSVNTPNIMVPIGNFLSTDFPNTGSSSQAVPININLNCSASANVWMSVNATADPSGATGAISLTGTGHKDVADGIAVQMLDANKNPVNLNKKFRYANTVSNGSLSIPWFARYLRTGTVKAGQANATATVSITYE